MADIQHTIYDNRNIDPSIFISIIYFGFKNSTQYLGERHTKEKFSIY
jgi:hypothetical protein